MQAKHDAETKKPELQDFGVTPEQYALYKGHQWGDISPLAFLVGLVVTTSTFIWIEVGNGWLSAIAPAIIWIGLAAYILLFTWTWHWSADEDDNEGLGVILRVIFSAFFALFVVPILIGFFVQWPVVQFKKSIMLKGIAISRIELYEEAEANYQTILEEAQRQEGIRQEAERHQREVERLQQSRQQAAYKLQQRKRQQYWESLGGIQFELELGKLFMAQGYNVKSTPVSGDQGVDLILIKNGKTTVVQCKAHKNPAVPSVVRELYGSMHHFKADSAILACTGGFTDGVVKFARGKPIELLSAWDIVRMADTSGEETQDMAEILPLCPTPGCMMTMELRSGRYGKFWGCPGYPTCRGTRNV